MNFKKAAVRPQEIKQKLCTISVKWLVFLKYCLLLTSTVSPFSTKVKTVCASNS